jgi:tetratricopeptide (TPR) repeat protein
MNLPEVLAAQWRIIDEARKKVPVVNYALAVAAFAACGSIALFFFGDRKVAVLATALVFVGAVLIFLFAQLATNNSTLFAAQFLLWSVLLFFASFLALTVSAFASGQPCNWAQFIGVPCSAEVVNCDRLERASWRFIERNQFCETARENGDRMLQQCADKSVAHNILGSAHYCLGKYEAALGNWQDAEKLQPSDRGYTQNKGAALIRLKRYAEATQLYGKLYRDGQNSGREIGSVTYNYALALLLERKLAEARRRYSELLDTPSHGLRAKFALAVVELLEGNCSVPDKKSREVAELVAIEPTLYPIAMGQLPAGPSELEAYVWAIRSACRNPDPFKISRS